jgi:hypothetical protein
MNNVLENEHGSVDIFSMTDFIPFRYILRTDIARCIVILSLLV